MKIFRKTCAVVLLVILVVNAVPTIAFANETHSFSSDSDKIRIEELNDSILYSYSDDNIVFCSQISYDGYVNFAYTKKEQNKIYESEAIKLDEIITGIDSNNLSKAIIIDNINFWSEQVMERLDDFEVNYTMNCDTPVVQSNSNLFDDVEICASTPISNMLTATYGSNYSNRLKGSSVKTHNGVSYNVYCKESQSTYQKKYATYEFAAGKTVAAIATWLATGGFSCTVKWFLSAAGAVTSTVSAAESIVYAIAGKMYIYECARTRIVTVPAYTSSTQYWAGWTIKSVFVDNGSTWDVSTISNIKHSDYDNVSGLMQTGFNNFISDYLQ